MFLLRSPTFYPRIHDLAFAIMNLDLGYIMNFITFMSMLDLEIRGDYFIRCVEDDHMLFLSDQIFSFVEVFNL
jgi:hypothetical protein